MAFEGVNITVSKLPNQYETKAIWEFKNLKSHLEVLTQFAECNVELGEKIKLKFFLKPVTPPHLPGWKYMSLNVQVKLKSKANLNSRHGATISIGFQYLSERRKDLGNQDGMCFLGTPKTIEVADLSMPSSHLIVDRFIVLSDSSYVQKLIDENVRHGITALVINFKTPEPQHPAKKPEPLTIPAHQLPEIQDLTLCDPSHTQDFTEMLNTPNNYSDLKLELEDGTTFKVHKCVLAARSTVFGTRIENEEKNNTFDGTMKIADAKKQPFAIILHWLYTGELKESFETLLEDVLNLAVTMELPAMISCVDHKLISICNVDNMFQLMHTAKKFHFQFSKGMITQYIKKNMDADMD